MFYKWSERKRIVPHTENLLKFYFLKRKKTGQLILKFRTFAESKIIAEFKKENKKRSVSL